MIQPLFDNAIVEIQSEESDSLIYKTEDSVDKLKTRVAKVVAVGQGYVNKDTRGYDGMLVNVGDKVLIINSSWIQLDSHNPKQLSVSQHSIIGILPKED